MPAAPVLMIGLEARCIRGLRFIGLISYWCLEDSLFADISRVSGTIYIAVYADTSSSPIVRDLSFIGIIV